MRWKERSVNLVLYPDQSGWSLFVYYSIIFGLISAAQLFGGIFGQTWCSAGAQRTKELRTEEKFKEEKKKNCSLCIRIASGQNFSLVKVQYCSLLVSTPLHTSLNFVIYFHSIITRISKFCLIPAQLICKYYDKRDFFFLLSKYFVIIIGIQCKSCAEHSQSALDWKKKAKERKFCNIFMLIAADNLYLWSWGGFFSCLIFFLQSACLCSFSPLSAL